MIDYKKVEDEIMDVLVKHDVTEYEALRVLDSVRSEAMANIIQRSVIHKMQTGKITLREVK